jgi:hypothetical protein
MRTGKTMLSADVEKRDRRKKSKPTYRAGNGNENSICISGILRQFNYWTRIICFGHDESVKKLYFSARI